ncbi:MAG TPA: beta-galactosidase trimerization domain-containing protein, partial [Candidatus Brocadiia bacterium]|nr:beta-galactosidase trimerization domain-containing protein [Candidatus Brocadiia bacterium]
MGKTTRKAAVAQPRDGQFDFLPLFGKQAAGNVAYAYVTLDSAKDQTVTLGMGADWWLQAWLDGKPLFDTLEEGNVEWPASMTNHLVHAALTKGKHVLTVRYVSGAGSSVLALGGPDDLRKVPPEKWRTVKPKDDSLYGAELVPNADFAKGQGTPWIPEGWRNGDGPRAFQGKELARVATAGGGALVVDTTGENAGEKLLYTRLSLHPGGLYKISYKSGDRRGRDICLMLRDDPASGPINLIQSINADKAARHVFIENPRPYLVLRVSGASHAVLDELSVKPCYDSSKNFDQWRTQRMPAPVAFHQISDAVVTPHAAWAKPYQGGTLKLLSIMPIWEQRESVEIAQRLDVQCRAVVFGNGAGVDKTPYWARDAKGELVLHDPVAAAMEGMAGDVDCILLDFVNAGAIPDTMVEAMMEKVKTGAGLVIVAINQPYYPYKDGRRPEALARFQQGAWAKALCPANATTDGTAYVSLGPVTKPDVEFYQHGKGRVVFLRGGDNLMGNNRAEFEFRMALFGKAILWAARKTPAVAIKSMELPGKQEALAATVRREALPSDVRIALDRKAAKGMKLRVWATDAQFSTLYEREQPIAEGSGAATVALPKLAAGTVYVNAQLFQDGRVCDWQTAALSVTADPVLKEVQLARGQRPYYVKGDTIAGSVILVRDLAAGERLEIALSDADGHLWNRLVLNTASQGAAPFSFDSAPLVNIRNAVRATVLDANGPVASAEAEVVLKYPKEWFANRFNLGVWHIGGGYLGGLQNRIYRDRYDVRFTLAGHQLGLAAQGIKQNIAPCFNAASGAHLFGMDNTIVGGKNAPARKACLTSPELRRKAAGVIKTVIEPGAKYAPLFYFLDHEVDLRGYTKRAPLDTDFCFSATCLNDLREFLKKDYSDLALLNKTWGTDFKQWSDVTPIVLGEAVREGQLPRWFDHRRHMDRVWADMTLFRMDEVRKYDPDGVGLNHNLRSGPTVNDSFSGIDYWQLLHEALGGSGGLPYAGDFTDASHLRMGAGAFWYPASMSDDPALTRCRFSRQPWSRLFSQYCAYNLYDEGFCPHHAVPPVINEIHTLNPDFTTDPMSEAFAGALRQIRAGIDTFVLNSRRDDRGVALYYSRPSEFACTAWQKVNGNSAAALAMDTRKSQFAFWGPSLKAVGRDFRSVAYAQVAGGLLRKEEIKLLVLPFTQAISLEEAQEIRAFVERGGWVVADIRPAICDEHGALHGQGLLDDVFGVKQNPAWASYVPKRGKAQLDIAENPLVVKTAFEDAILGPDLQLAGGRALGKADAPVFIVNRFGRGQAILLNFYAEAGAANAKSCEALLDGLLAARGIGRLLDYTVSDVVWFTGGGERVKPSQAQEEARGASSGLRKSEDAGEVEGLSLALTQRQTPGVVRLRNGGITACAQLAEADENALATIISAPAWRRINCASWIEQARLAAAGDTTGLQELQ